MTRRYKITLAYDGTNFAGFRVQPNQRTVQSVLEAAVNKMSKNSDYITIYGSGRTDAGVHALGQVVHFDFPHDIPAEGMLKGLNSMLPLDCEVVGCEIVPTTSMLVLRRMASATCTVSVAGVLRTRSSVFTRVTTNIRWTLKNQGSHARSGGNA